MDLKNGPRNKCTIIGNISYYEPSKKTCSGELTVVLLSRNDAKTKNTESLH